MRQNKRYFKFLSCALVVALVFACFSSPAYAIDFNSARANRFKALIASAIQAINIGLSASQATFSDLTNYIADPFDFVYTYSEQASDDYWNQQTIHIYDDYIVIDGVPYTDIWLSHDIAEKMRVDAFDFQTAYSIASNTNGTFASGSGLWRNIPVYSTGSKYRTQFYEVPRVGSYSVGSFNFVSSFDHTSGHYDFYAVTATDTRSGQTYSVTAQDFSQGTKPWGIAGNFSTPTNNNGVFQIGDWWTGTYPSGYFSSPVNIAPFENFTTAPFDFDYVAGTIPASEPLPENTGLMLRVPSSAIDQWMEDNPDETDVDWDIDLDSPDISAKLDDLFDLIVPIIPIIEANFSEQHAPVPGETISNTEYNILDQTLQDIREDIQAIPGAIQQIVSPFFNTILETLSDIADGIDSLLQTIENADFNFIDTFWKNFLTPFLNLFNLIKSHLTIWHYVVEWLSSISSVFTFFLGVLSGAGSGYLLPIYACFAGTVVIAVYRRFGK